MPHITADICTKDRYDSLAVALMSIAMQTRKPDKLIIYDDSKFRADLRSRKLFTNIFDVLNVNKIEWEVVFGANRGQHWGHQIIQDRAKELIWRIDDDEVAQPTVLEILERHLLDPACGAAAGLVLPPSYETRDWPANTITNTEQGNCQWYKWAGLKECEHLYSSYLYRKGIQNYELNLSRVAHREETLHTYGIFKKGYKLIVDPRAITYHFRATEGGIRGEGQLADWQHDEIAFHEILNEYEGHKVCYLDSGMGDHIVFKSILPKIKEKYKDVTLAVCFPELFPEEKCISLAEGQQICNPDRHNVFKWCIDHGWGRKEIKYAYAEMYGVEI